ncbi:MAG: SCP2 sterol-binding domain-containing protein [Myxococcota bacterium]
MSFKVSSVEEYFETLEKRFNADGAKGVSAIYQFELGDAGTWHVSVEDGAMSLAEGAHDKPTTTIKMTGENFVKMSNGELSGQMAYMTGKMKIKGSIPMAMKMKNIFPQVG